MIKSSVRGVKSHSKSGAKINTKPSGGVGKGFYGTHDKQTIRPSKVGTKISPPAFGRKSGVERIKTTGGY